jgi:hypothetical protein
MLPGSLADMVYVYIDNAHNVSLYHPVMTFNGGNLDELKRELRDRMGIPDKVMLDVYNRRIGGLGRKLLSTLPQDLTDVYVLLKVEGNNAGNQRSAIVAE